MCLAEEDEGRQSNRDAFLPANNSKALNRDHDEVSVSPSFSDHPPQQPKEAADG